MEVSIIIVNWNTCDILRDCVASIYAQAKDIKFEVIVIDNASTDGSVEMVKKDFHQVTLLENAENRGFAAANNQGLAIAKGRYILLLNSDTIVLDNTIAKSISFADLHPKAAVVGCRILNPDMTLQPSCFMFPSLLNMLLSASYLYKLFPGNNFLGRERMTWWDRNDVREVDVVTGCFMLVRREAVEQVGMMDEQFFMYGEETDWCYRFKQAGWKVIFTPVSKIIHLSGQSTIKVRGDMLVQLRLSILKFIRKHRSWLTHKIACFFIAMFFVVRAPLWVVVSVVRHKHRKEATVKWRAYISGIGQILFKFTDSPPGKKWT